MAILHEIDYPSIDYELSSTIDLSTISPIEAPELHYTLGRSRRSRRATMGEYQLLPIDAQSRLASMGGAPKKSPRTKKTPSKK